MSEVTVSRAPRHGMIALRGDLASQALRDACTAVTGVAFPEALRICGEGETALAWMSPDEVLVMMPHERAHAAASDIKVALQDTHFMVENLSDARALFTVRGGHCREVIAKNAPVDLHPDAFAPGQFRRSRLGQVAAAFWMSDAQTFQVICFASVADYVAELLGVSARMGPVGHF